jgi:hypothetical protein
MRPYALLCYEAAAAKWSFHGFCLDNVLCDANADQSLPDVES